MIISLNLVNVMRFVKDKDCPLPHHYSMDESARGAGVPDLSRLWLV